MDDRASVAIGRPVAFPRPSPYLLAAMDDGIRQQLIPGATVKVVQQIAGRDYTWTSEVVGTVERFDQQETGSWYAHSKNDKLWLDRLRLRKSDGEIITLNLDGYSVVQILSAPASNDPKSQESATS
jgi:hypothetical protein